MCMCDLPRHICRFLRVCCVLLRGYGMRSNRVLRVLWFHFALGGGFGNHTRTLGNRSQTNMPTHANKETGFGNQLTPASLWMRGRDGLSPTQLAPVSRVSTHQAMSQARPSQQPSRYCPESSSLAGFHATSGSLAPRWQTITLAPFVESPRRNSQPAPPTLMNLHADPYPTR